VADPAMVQVLRSAERVAGLGMPVLVMGETGSGKEIVSEAVHALGPRAAMPLVKLNCAAVPENLLESELFGFERGAFSGAVAAKPGRIEQADGGTLFLDEIGEMPLPLQAKILRVVEDKRVQRLGASKDRAINVRFVAATHRDLQAAVEAGRFRQDLYYRLATLQIRIPPLRERPREIVLLAQRIAAEAAAALGRDVPGFTDAALRALVAYSWPGNIRELRNVISQAVVFCEDAVLDVPHLGPVAATEETRTPASHPGTWPGGAPEPSSRPGSALAPARPLEEELRKVERARIVEALEACAGNQTKAAELLRMPRRTLVSRMAALGIPGRRQGSGAGPASTGKPQGK
jgi:two-component system, NtrC family, response regulator AtoC